MSEQLTKGRVTIPTDMDVVPQTLEILKKWGADAIRDCDGTDFPQELKDADAKIYSTYYTTRKDNTWAKANPDEIQQMYLMTPFYTAAEGELSIKLMKGLYPDMLKVNPKDRERWWEVIDRTTGKTVPPEQWNYNEDDGCVHIPAAEPFHQYTVSFLAFIMWDPVHMYNAVVNGWKNVEHQITFDVRQPKTHAFTMERLRRFIKEHPYVDVIRYTTFFHQFTLVFDEQAREKFVDWYGYSASVSPYILEQFEKEVGYKFRPEFIIDQGYHNNQYRIPSKEYKDLLKLEPKDNARATMYAEVLRVISSFENGVGAAIHNKYNELNRKLTIAEVQMLISEQAESPVMVPFLYDARQKMASRDLGLRDVYHDNIAEYIRAMSPEEFDRFIGTESIDLEKLLDNDENRKTLERLKK